MNWTTNPWPILADAGLERSEDVVQMFRPAGFTAGAARPSRDEVEAAARTFG